MNHLEKDQRWPMADREGNLFYVMEDQEGSDRFYDSRGTAVSGPFPGGITFPSTGGGGSIVVFESGGGLLRCSTEDFIPEEIYLPATVDLPFPDEELFFAGVYTSDFAVEPDGGYMIMEAEGRSMPFQWRRTAPVTR